MAEVATGRSRVCTVALRAESTQDTRYHLVFNVGLGVYQWQSNDDDHSFANCGGLTMSLVVDSQVPPSSGTRATRATFAASFIPGGPFIHQAELSCGFVNTSYPANLTAPDVASSVWATVTGTLTLSEYADEVEANALYERVTAYDLTFASAGACSIAGTGGGGDTGAFSDNYADASVASPVLITLADYGVTLDYLGCFRLNQPNASVSLTADGLTYDNRALSAHYEGSLPGSPYYYGGATDWTFDVGGTMLSPTLIWSHGGTYGSSAPVASLTIELWPEWALSVSTLATDYRTGDPLASQPGVYRSVWVDDTSPMLEVEYDSDGNLRDPVTGFKRYATCQVTFNLPDPDISDTLVGELDHLPFYLVPAALHLFHVDPAWGDAIGRTLRSYNFQGKNDFYSFPLGETFIAAGLTFAETHQFGVFDTDSHWNTVSGSPSLAVVGGALEIDTGGAAEIWTGTASPGTFDYALKWFAFRFHRLRVKCSIGGTAFTLKLSTGTISPATSYVAEWDVTATDADAWETHELDLLYPDRITDTESATYAPNHAARFPNGMAVSIECADDVVLTIDYIEGYRKTDGERTPLLLAAPLSCNGTFGGDVTDLAAPVGDLPVFVSTGPVGGLLYGRLVVNGMRALDFRYTSNGTVDEAWNDGVLGTGGFNTWYDTAANDTGLTIFNPLPPNLGAFARHFNGYPVAEGAPLWQELTAGVEFDVMAQAHLAAYGYFGSGDATSPTGYSEVLVLSGRKAWNGEIAGQMSVGKASAAGVAIELRDNDTDAVLDTTSTDDDGLWRLFGPFGEIFPVGNVDNSLWSGVPPTYTTAGLLFNSHWLVGARIEQDKDDTFHLLTTGAIRDYFEIYDRYMRWQDFCKVVIADTDMTETANGWLWRVGRINESDIVAEFSVDAGKTWTATERIGESDVAAPTIACDRWDNLFVWFHDADNAYGYRSFDYGATWELFATHADLVFPRVAVGLGETFLALHDDATTLTVYRSVDLGETLDETLFTQEAPPQLACLEYDRRGELHLVYRDDGTPVKLWHRWRDDPDGDEFSDAAEWAEGEFPALAFGQEQRQPPEGGLFSFYDGDELQIRATDSTGLELDATVLTTPAGAYEPGYVGLLLDRRGVGWATLKPSGPDVESQFTGDSLVGWSAP